MAPIAGESDLNFTDILNLKHVLLIWPERFYKILRLRLNNVNRKAGRRQRICLLPASQQITLAKKADLLGLGNVEIVPIWHNYRG